MAARTMLKALRNRSLSSIASSSFSIRNPFSRFISTLVVAEHEGGFVKPSSLSAVAAAGSISKENSISVLLGGSGASLQKAATHAASCHPLVSKVLVADADMLMYPLAETWAELIHLVQQKGSYSYVVAASNSFGKNVLPRAAALLDASPITDVIEISEPRMFVRPIYAGNALCTVRYTGLDPCVITIRSTSFSVPPIPNDAVSDAAPISQVDLSTFSEETLGKSKWLKLTSEDTERPDLGNARVVVTGGRGLKSAENFKLLEKLAEKLGAAVGATRAAVDAGFVPNDLQERKKGKKEMKMEEVFFTKVAPNPLMSPLSSLMLATRSGGIHLMEELYETPSRYDLSKRRVAGRACASPMLVVVSGGLRDVGGSGGTFLVWARMHATRVVVLSLSN